MFDSQPIHRCREAGDSCARLGARLGARLASIRHMESSSRWRSEEEEGEREVGLLTGLETKRSITWLRSMPEMMSALMSLEETAGVDDGGWSASGAAAIVLCGGNE